MPDRLTIRVFSAAVSLGLAAACLGCTQGNPAYRPVTALPVDAAPSPDAATMPDAPSPDGSPAPDVPPPDLAANLERDSSPDLGGAAPDAAFTYPLGTLVGHWRFDESSGAMAADSSPYLNHGTLEDFDLPSAWRSARRNGGLAFTRARPDLGVKVALSPSLRHASIRTRRGAPRGARCTLGSDPKALDDLWTFINVKAKFEMAATLFDDFNTAYANASLPVGDILRRMANLEMQRTTTLPPFAPAGVRR